MDKLILVGSRKLKISKKDSDYDYLLVVKGDFNKHIMTIREIYGKKADVHTYCFENKTKLIQYLLRDCSSFSLACVIYPEFREFWDMTVNEALDVIKVCERNKEILRPYERAYFNGQLYNVPVSKRYLKALYKGYKASLKR